MKPVIHISNLTKRYRRETALDNVSFEVPPGMVFGLLGENGAGKTTAIRVMLGLTGADAGEARVLEMDSRRKGLSIRRQVGYVPEQPTFYDWMTVHEIGWFTAGFYGDGYEVRYRRMAERFGLPPDRKIKALSKGMRAKVCLSLAMAHEPEVLILDEPTSGLDTLVRREFLQGMVDWAAAGRTVLLSSHQINEVERVADMVAILHEGHLVLVDRLDRLKSEMAELIVTVADGDVELPALPGQIITQRRRGRQWQLLVRGDVDQQQRRLEGDASVRAVESRSPTLEEIFVGYIQAGHPARAGEKDRAPVSEETSAP